MDPILLLVIVAGLCAGSFLNVLIVRLPDAERSLLRPLFSACPVCGARVRAIDNVPVLSHVLLRGRCRACSTRIGTLYPVVELLTAVGWSAVYLRFGLGAEGVAAAAFLWLLLGAAATDARTYLIPDVYTIGGAGVGLVAAALIGGLAAAGRALGDALLVGAALFAIGWGVGRLVRKEALGFGDVLLVAMMATFLGFGATIVAIYAGAVSGLVVYFGYQRWVKKDQPLIPFGLHLAVGGAVSLFLGGTDFARIIETVLPWY